MSKQNKIKKQKASTRYMNINLIRPIQKKGKLNRKTCICIFFFEEIM